MELYDYQYDAVEKLKNGSILCGGVGSGKSLTALYYYITKVCKGEIKTVLDELPFNICDTYRKMEDPRDLYIITTAKKRDSLEWNKECSKCCLSSDPEISHSGVKVTIDSWNNIKKYEKVSEAFFIFDEQRVVGNGAWVKSFLKITKLNKWILLSATPGDQWKDYIPVFIANGFYKNKSEFNIRHCVFKPYMNYPVIQKYVDEKTLIKHRDSILVHMDDNRKTVRHEVVVKVGYDKALYRTVMKDRWNPYDNEPIRETGALLYLLRRVVNSDPERILKVSQIFELKKKLIVFYNFNYELDMLRQYCEDNGIVYSEWNGQKHEEVPESESWIYMVQYSAGSEGWNCIETDTIVFYSQNYSYRMVEQASGRIDRINTPYKDLYYYHFRSMSQIDIAIHRALNAKRNFNESSFIRRMKDG